MTIRDLQANLPWGNPYTPAFQKDPRVHKDFEHALLHVFKSAGKLAAIAEAEDHRKVPNEDYEDVPKWIADLVICAVRMAKTGPVPVDLEAVVIARLKDKNPGWQER